jgi:hypothetical protein
MALQICKECGGQVSSDAKFCPHCGSIGFDTPMVVKQVTSGVIGCGCIVILAIFFLVVIASLIAGKHLPPSDPKNARAEREIG